MSEERKEKFSSKYPTISPLLTAFLTVSFYFILLWLLYPISKSFVPYLLQSPGYDVSNIQSQIYFCEDASESALILKQSKDNGTTYDTQLNVIKAVVKNDSESKISYYKHLLDITYENKDSDNVKFGFIVKDMCLTENWKF